MLHVIASDGVLQKRRAKPKAATGERRASGAKAARVYVVPPYLVDTMKVFGLFSRHMGGGEHLFAELHSQFLEWCEAADVPAASKPMLARWLGAAGWTKRRVGKNKATAYAPPKVGARAARCVV